MSEREKRRRIKILTAKYEKKKKENEQLQMEIDILKEKRNQSTSNNPILKHQEEINIERNFLKDNFNLIKNQITILESYRKIEGIINVSTHDLDDMTHVFNCNELNEKDVNEFCEVFLNFNQISPPYKCKFDIEGENSIFIIFKKI